MGRSAARSRARGCESSSSARSGGRGCFGIGVVVQEHRHRELVGPPLAERAGLLGRLRPLDLGAAERDERHDVEGAEAGMLAVVTDDRALLGDGRRERPRALGTASRGPGPASVNTER